MTMTTPPTSGPLRTKLRCVRRTKTLMPPKSFDTTTKAAMTTMNEKSGVRLSQLAPAVSLP